MVLKRFLELEGFTVTTLSAGGRLMSILTTDPPDLLLLDVTLPDVDGSVLLREFRGQGIDIPVLLMSGHVDVRERFIVQYGEQTGFLPKPFRLDDIRERIGTLLPRTAESPGSTVS